MEVVCKMDMKSIHTLVANLRSMLENAVEEAGEELKDVAECIILESAVECPKRTGTLVSASYVGEPVRAPGGVSVELGYGGPADVGNPVTGQMASEYMVIVHEDLSKMHPIGKAKFLEDPVRRNEQFLVERLGDRVRVALTIKPGG